MFSRLIQSRWIVAIAGTALALLIIYVLSLPVEQKGANTSLETPSTGDERYTNYRYGFSFVLPKEVALTVTEQGAAAATFVFEHSSRQEGFQVFVVPYAEETISEERFLLDIPSGVRSEEVPFMLSGYPAVSFISEDKSLGKTREIWVLRRGYLYEITAPYDLDFWLGSILETWDFF